jgi:hypothetical protein
MDHLPPQVLLSLSLVPSAAAITAKILVFLSMHFYITLNQFLYNLSVVMSVLFKNKVFGETGF